MGEPGALHLYRELRERGLRPALLESLGSRTAFARRTVLGFDPVCRLEVWDGRLYEDGREAGAAQDILARLELPARDGFFPAWIGFLSYEFAAPPRAAHQRPDARDCRRRPSSTTPRASSGRTARSSSGRGTTGARGGGGGGGRAAAASSEASLPRDRP